jgi:hypothetical protein
VEVSLPLALALSPETLYGPTGVLSPAGAQTLLKLPPVSGGVYRI